MAQDRTRADAIADGSIQIAEAEIFNDDGTLIAKASGTEIPV